jgi:hypothetical protein
VRAQGPFGHSILAGTVGAVCLPLFIAIWRKYRKAAITGLAACLLIIYACASSGPILSALAAISGLVMWHYRQYMRHVRWLAVFGYIGLAVVMKTPPYYLLERLDLVGGSTGWHRAHLIESAINHLKEWWLAGTDFTRHWMPTGVSWSPNHTDITNYYIHVGVWGGIPALLLLIATLTIAFSYVGRILQKQVPLYPHESRFMIWALGSSLFAHTVTCIAISYFDQSSLFLYMTLAMIGSAWSGTRVTRSKAEILLRLHKSPIAAEITTNPGRGASLT